MCSPRTAPTIRPTGHQEADPCLAQEEGSRAVAEAVALCRPEVVSAYPISPQTHIVEHISDLVRTGDLSPCEYLMVESEFGAMSAAIGASAAGARTYTATASQGLLFMAEALYNASGLGLPIVMTIANRAIGAPINIWNDHSDSMSQRDSGWIQLYAESNQEALDLHIQAYRIAEQLSLPVMVCMDGFILTHAYEEVDIPDQDSVDAFLPPFEPRQLLDPGSPGDDRGDGRARGVLRGQVPSPREADAGAGRDPRRRAAILDRLRSSLRWPGAPLPHRGRGDDPGRPRLRAGHDRGSRRRDARCGRPRRSAGDQVVPAVPARRGP